MSAAGGGSEAAGEAGVRLAADGVLVASSAGRDSAHPTTNEMTSAAADFRARERAI